MQDQVTGARSRIRKLVKRIPCFDQSCVTQNSPYSENCEKCGKPLSGGIIFSTGQSGTAQREYLDEVRKKVDTVGCCHLHDVAVTMEQFAREFDPNINWDKVLDRPEEELRFRRAQAFGEIKPSIISAPNDVHIIACHLTFRWRAYLTRGFDPHLMTGIDQWLRLFVTVIDGVDDVHKRLTATDWGTRKRLELALSRDEEVFITSLLADVYRRPHYIVARQEPPDNISELILNPWKPRAYLSFPITALKGDDEARKTIEKVRDTIRQWLVVFDPYAIKDYDLTYQVPEMAAIAEELGEQTEQRDFRFIDQSEVLIAFFPKAVPSKGVEAELRHAKTTGKVIYLCYPKKTGGPFSISPDFFTSSPDEFLELICSHFEGLDKPTDI